MQTWQRRARRNIENNEKFVSLDMELIEFGFGIFHNSPPRRRNQIAVCCTMIEGKRDVKARHKIDSKKSLKRGIRNHFLMFRGIGFLVKLNFSTDRFISIQKIIHKPIKTYHCNCRDGGKVNSVLKVQTLSCFVQANAAIALLSIFKEIIDD